jgi:hypothetical protein
MRSTTLAVPQSLNLYAYCTNDPINHADPSGLGFFSFLKKLFKIITKILTIVAIVATVLLLITFVPGSVGAVAKVLLGIIMKAMSFLGPLKFAAGGAGGEGGWTLNPIGLIFSAVLGAGAIANRLVQDPPDDDTDVIRIETNCPTDAKLPGETPRLCPTVNPIFLILVMTAESLRRFFGGKPRQVVITVGTSNAPAEQAKDPCDALAAANETESATVFGAGEAVNEASGGPGTHAATAAGKIGSRVMPALGELGTMAPGIAKIRLYQMCQEKMANNADNPQCLLDPSKCKKP